MSSNELHIVVPGVPPGFNHYVRHTYTRHYVTKEAIVFKTELTLAVGQSWVVGKEFSVEAEIYLGKNQRGDVDGFSKLVLDGLANAGVFRQIRGQQLCKLSDSYVTELMLYKRRDIKNPRTEIHVKAIS